MDSDGGAVTACGAGSALLHAVCPLRQCICLLCCETAGPMLSALCESVVLCPYEQMKCRAPTPHCDNELRNHFTSSHRTVSLAREQLFQCLLVLSRGTIFGRDVSADGWYICTSGIEQSTTFGPFFLPCHNVQRYMVCS